MSANSEGSDESVQVCMLTWAIAVHLCDKYHNLMSWLIYILTWADMSRARLKTTTEREGMIRRFCQLANRQWPYLIFPALILLWLTPHIPSLAVHHSETIQDYTIVIYRNDPMFSDWQVWGRRTSDLSENCILAQILIHLPISLHWKKAHAQNLMEPFWKTMRLFSTGPLPGISLNCKA